MNIESISTTQLISNIDELINKIKSLEIQLNQNKFLFQNNGLTNIQLDYFEKLKIYYNQQCKKFKLNQWLSEIKKYQELNQKLTDEQKFQFDLIEFDFIHQCKELINEINVCGVKKK